MLDVFIHIRLTLILLYSVSLGGYVYSYLLASEYYVYFRASEFNLAHAAM